MEKHYVIFVEFAKTTRTSTPITQTIDVRSGGVELGVLIAALDASADVVSIDVWHKSHNVAKMLKMTGSDLGMSDIKKIK